MRNQIYISQKWRKFTALFLLLNFFVAPLLNAIPQAVCNGVCEMESLNHECGTHETEVMKKSSCNMMKMNSNSTATTTACGMDLSDLNCALIFHGQDNPTYLVPETIDCKIEFVQISTINFNENNSEIEFFELIQDNSYRKKPPIYLTNSVFLI